MDGKSLEESHFGSALELNVVSILRDQQTILAPGPDLILRSGDRLLVEGQLDRLFEIYSPDHQFLDQESLPIEKIYSAEIKLAEVTIPSGSSLIDSTLPQVAFRHVYNLIVLAIRREDITYYTDLEDLPLRESDVLLVKGRQSDLNVLQGDKDTILSIPDSFQDYNLEDHLMMVRIPEGSALAGNSIISSRLGDAFGLSIQGIIRKDKTELMPSPEEILEVGDTLIVKGKIEDLHTIQGLQNLLIEADTQPDLTELETDETGLIEAVLSPRSTLTGKAIRELMNSPTRALNVDNY